MYAKRKTVDIRNEKRLAKIAQDDRSQTLGRASKRCAET